MITLTDRKTFVPATEASTGRAGELSTYVEARIRGNYKKGPVPVTVEYQFRFRYEEEWADETGNTVLYLSKAFETAEERDAYVGNCFIITK
jgi:hypothetical protein